MSITYNFKRLLRGSALTLACSVTFNSSAMAMDCHSFEVLVDNLVRYSNEASAIVESCSRDVRAQRRNSKNCSRLHGDDPTMLRFTNYMQQYEQFAGNSLLNGFLKGVEMAKCARVDPAALGSAMNRYNSATQELLRLAN